MEEQFTLLEEGRPIPDFDQDLAEAFARDIVPEGLSQLFFFDAEKIRELAEDQTGEDALAESIKALLGLDTVERLSADLTIYASRKTAELAGKDDQVRLQELEAEAAQLRQATEQVESHIQTLRGELEIVEQDATAAEDKLRQEGHTFARQREELKAKVQHLKAEISCKEVALASLCEGVLPLALCPNTAARLRNQMELEAEQERRRNFGREIGALSHDLMDRLLAQRAKLNNKAKAAAQAADLIISEVRDCMQQRQQSIATGGATEFLHLSKTEVAAIMELMNQAGAVAKPSAAELCRGLERDVRALTEATKHLEKIPADDVTAPIMEQIQKVHQQLGALHQKLKQAEEDRHALTLKIQDMEVSLHGLCRAA